jgi:hypothetical protein
MNTPQTNQANADWVQIVRQHVEPLNYGSVEIIVQDSRIIQIEKTQRWRLPKRRSADRPAIPEATRFGPRAPLK